MRLLAFLAAALLVSACAPTARVQAVSFVDPQFRGPGVTSFVIETQDAGLQESAALEQGTAAYFAQAGFLARTSLDLAPPTRNYSQREMERIYEKSGAQALLVIKPSKRETLRDYIPPSYTPGRLQTYRAHGETVAFYEPGYYDRGYVVDYPRSTYAAEAFRIPGFAKIWQAEFTLQGSGGTDQGFLDMSLGQALAERMAMDGIIPLPAAPAKP